MIHQEPTPPAPAEVCEPDVIRHIFQQGVADAHIAELKKQLADANATILRLNGRGGYTASDMMDHAIKARADERKKFGKLTEHAAREQPTTESK